jgi:hypothetical protein
MFGILDRVAALNILHFESGFGLFGMEIMDGMRFFR